MWCPTPDRAEGPPLTAARPSTLQELRASGWKSKPVKDELRDNFLAAQIEVGVDPLSSPFYTRPVGILPHELMFAEDSPEARLILEWIGGESP